MQVKLRRFYVRRTRNCGGGGILLVVADSVIWQGMLLLYVWPLMALIVGGVLGQVVAGELGAMMGAFSGLFFSLLSVRWRTQREHDNYLPIVIKKLI
ncbi:MAG: SoxR reducing system RseC family protein [Moraxellaceae bacterium]|nr:SoxR reducing system RseC family protein [Moraxellaceae bacterium]